MQKQHAALHPHSPLTRPPPIAAAAHVAVRVGELLGEALEPVAQALDLGVPRPRLLLVRHQRAHQLAVLFVALVQAGHQRGHVLEQRLLVAVRVEPAAGAQSQQHQDQQLAPVAEHAHSYRLVALPAKQREGGRAAAGRGWRWAAAAEGCTGSLHRPTIRCRCDPARDKVLAKAHGARRRSPAPHRPGRHHRAARHRPQGCCRFVKVQSMPGFDTPSPSSSVQGMAVMAPGVASQHAHPAAYAPIDRT